MTGEIAERRIRRGGSERREKREERKEKREEKREEKRAQRGRRNKSCL
jgi:hypothetical protein